MEPTGTLASVLPQLSIGVICVLAFTLITYLFIKHIKESDIAAAKERVDFLSLIERKEKHSADERFQHNAKLEEHHKAMSALEGEMRGNVLAQIKETTGQLKENTHLMTRVIDFFEQPNMNLVAARPQRRQPRRPTVRV